MQATGSTIALGAEEQALGYFVPEPFPSITTGTSIRSGKFGGQVLTLQSRMNEGGVIFADGIEQDYLAFDWGRQVAVGVAESRLHLVLA